MAVCVEKLPHSCGTRDGLQVFEEEGKYTGYCFSCDTYIRNPYEDKPEDYKPNVIIKSEKDVEKEIEAISDYTTTDLPERGLRKDSLEYFNIKIGLSEEDGETPVTHYYPYYDPSEKLTGYKVRLIEGKKMWVVGSIKDSKPFGWKQAVTAGGKKLFICEGEMDAVALYQICKDFNAGTRYEKFDPAIISVKNGASSATKDLTDNLNEIRKIWDEIVLVFDQDDAGKSAVEKVLRVIPDAKVATLPGKDVNDCLLKGRSRAVYQAVQFNASKPKNTRLVNASTLFQDAKKAPEWGVPWPWKHITETTRGIRKGETIYIGAGQKMGKSEVVNALAAHFITELDWKVMLAKPEEANVKTVKLVAGKIAGKSFHDPKVEFDEKAYDEAVEKIGSNLLLINLYQHLGWDTLQADIREAAQEGCDAIFIDPITNLVNGMSASDQNTKLQEIAQELSAMALDLDVVIFIFCHLRNPDSGDPHDRGGEVLSSQFAGSRAMARSCNLMLGIEGNKDPELSVEERNIRTLVLLEDREYGEVGRFKLYWDRHTTLFNEC
ncbi:MAG TPA: DnaB-like helicase C-terminal domain-containing protein [Tissierellaceae bacterium]|nr:DnaB-like helicase C-terminal domain-containing protein [Tissierellaceae bacterium]